MFVRPHLQLVGLGDNLVGARRHGSHDQLVVDGGVEGGHLERGLGEEGLALSGVGGHFDVGFDDAGGIVCFGTTNICLINIKVGIILKKCLRRRAVGKTD